MTSFLIGVVVGIAITIILLVALVVWVFKLILEDYDEEYKQIQ